MGCDAGAQRGAASHECTGLRNWLADRLERSPSPTTAASARPAASCCPYAGAGAGCPLLSPALGEAVLGLAPSPEQHSGSATLPAHGTPTAGVPWKQDAGVDQGAVAGPSLLGPLTYWSAAAWARTPRRAAGESCSPGEPSSPPRPPWGVWGVSPPS